MMNKRVLWIAGQVLAIVPTFLAFSTVMDMTFAKPGGSYVDESKVLVRCEALAMPTKKWHAPRCASFGSMETNPGGYAAAWLGLAACFGFLWLSSRPGRGLKP